MRVLSVLFLCLMASGAAAQSRVTAQGCVQLKAMRGGAEIWADVTSPAGEAYCPQAPTLAAPPAAPPRLVAPEAEPAQVARVSTREGLHFVQVGAFLREANAANVAARLDAAGFGVERRLLRKDGQTLKGVSAGPFATEEALEKALKRLKSLGFIDAFVR